MHKFATALAACAVARAAHTADASQVLDTVKARGEAICGVNPDVWRGDDQLADIVRLSPCVMVEAEEHGIASRNVDHTLDIDNPTIKRTLGVDEKWVYKVIGPAGNHGGSYDRNVGRSTVLRIPHGPNEPIH